MKNYQKQLNKLSDYYHEEMIKYRYANDGDEENERNEAFYEGCKCAISDVRRCLSIEDNTNYANGMAIVWDYLDRYWESGKNMRERAFINGLRDAIARKLSEAGLE